MPQPSIITERLGKEITRLRLNPPYPGAKRIYDLLLSRRAELVQAGVIEEDYELPSPKTVQRHLTKYVDSIPPDERRRYLLARWPDAFGTQALPWESAGAVRELTAVLGRIPEISLATWYWKVRLRWPDTTHMDRGDSFERARYCIAWASAFALADLVPSWPPIVSQRLNEGYEPPSRELDSWDMSYLIRGERAPSGDEKRAMVRRVLDDAE